MKKIQNENNFIDYKEIIEQIIKRNKSREIINYKREIDNILNETDVIKNKIDNSTSIDTLNEINKKIISTIERAFSLEELFMGNEQTKELNKNIHTALMKYRNIQILLLNRKIELTNNYIEEKDKYIDKKIANIDELLSSILFNVISIFLGISIVTSMVAGMEYIESNYILFYFMSCAWIAITILVISSYLLKSDTSKVKCILNYYLIYTLIYIIIGIVSFCCK